MKTLTIKELIAYLEQIGGDKKVYISRDEEGNGFGTILKKSIEINKDYIIIYPYDEYVELGKDTN